MAKIDKQSTAAAGGAADAPDYSALPVWRAIQDVRSAVIKAVDGDSLVVLDLPDESLVIPFSGRGEVGDYLVVDGDRVEVVSKAAFERAFKRLGAPIPPGHDHLAVLEVLRASYDPADLKVEAGAGVTRVSRRSAPYVPALELAHDARHDPLEAIARLRDHGKGHDYAA